MSIIIIYFLMFLLFIVLGITKSPRSVYNNYIVNKVTCNSDNKQNENLF